VVQSGVRLTVGKGVKQFHRFFPIALIYQVHNLVLKNFLFASDVCVVGNPKVVCC
jgi:hypothetical protein